MKRISVFVLILTLLAALVVPCAAAESTYVRIPVEMTDEQVETIETLEQAIRKNFGMDAFFLYDDVHPEGGEKFVDYADRFLTYSTNAKNATILAICDKSYYVASKGKAEELVNGDDADALYEAVQYYDERGEYFNTAAQYYSALQALLAKRFNPVDAANSSSSTATYVNSSGELETYDPKDVPYIPTEIAKERAQRLYDGADLLTDDEEAALLEQLNTRSEELQFDIVVVTAKSIGARSPMEFADDYFDYNGFGYGESFDGCLLLISMADRDWYVSTCGFGETALDSDYFINFISSDHFLYALKDGEYSESFDRFVELVNDFVIEAREDEPYSPSHRYNDAKNKIIGLIISLIIGLIIGAIVTFSKRSGYTHAVRREVGAGDYLVNGSMQLTEQSDRFLYTNLDRTRRVQESSSSSSSGGSYSSGSHTSSSGRSHGGGGGKF